MKNYFKNFKITSFTVVMFLAALTLVCALAYFDCQSVYSLAAFTPCLGAIADSVNQDCDNPRVSGYENIALIFNRADIDWTAVTINSSNPRIVEALAMATGKTPFVIYNPKVNPASFNGTNATLNTDTDRYDKTVQFYYEGIGGGSAQDVVEPLKSGDFIIMLQRKDHRGDGSFELVGFQSGLKATAQVQDEETGYWLMTMTTSEPSAEISFFKTDYANTKSMFDTLLALVP